MLVIVGQFLYNLIWAWAMANYQKGDLEAYSILTLAEANTHRVISFAMWVWEYKEVSISWFQR